MLQAIQIVRRTVQAFCLLSIIWKIPVGNCYDVQSILHADFFGAGERCRNNGLLGVVHYRTSRLSVLQ
jgi:hypothetical protein